eukprot:347947-Chlamydomonas_euryale.AAC.20
MRAHTQRPCKGQMGDGTREWHEGDGARGGAPPSCTLTAAALRAVAAAAARGAWCADRVARRRVAVAQVTRPRRQCRVRHQQS